MSGAVARPAGHSVQALAPPPEACTVGYEPAGQGSQAASEIAPGVREILPAAQTSHTADVAAPVTPEKRPAGQRVQRAAATGAKLPAGQTVHCAGASPHTAPADKDALPAPQTSQAAL